MSPSTQPAPLRTEIASHLPLLEQRARRRELDALIREALALGPASPLGFLQLATSYELRSSARRERFLSFQTAYARGASAAERTAVIEAALREEGAPPRAFRAVRRGWLDVDAMAERAELELHDLEVRRALALRAAVALCNKGTEVSVLRAVLVVILDLLLGQPSPLCAVAGAEALTELLPRMPARAVVLRASDGSEDPELLLRWQRLCASLPEPMAARPRRVMAALCRLCLRALPELALPSLQAILMRTTGGDDFLLRQHVVVLLGEREGDAAAFALLANKAQAGDSSEHVRVALPAALRSTGSESAVALLERLAGAAVGVPGDPSPKVRATATIALAELLRARAAATASALGRLLADPEPLVSRVAAEEVEDLALHGRLSEAEAASLREVAARLVAQAPTTAAAEPALRAIEALAAVTEWPLAIARSLLAQHLETLPNGESVWLQTKADPVTFGRLLSQVARNGFGFYAEPGEGGYHVERGARFVHRAWRFLHELRWHTPYKRQDGIHSIGRQFDGRLRAPSGLLAEATNTQVPGEPLASSSDGAWGPHVPLVDDLLSTSVLHPEPVMLFTSRGVTEITPPKSLFSRLRARLQLSARYASFAELRLRALDPADPSERTRYIEAVRELGFGVTLKPYPAESLPQVALVPAAQAPFGQVPQPSSAAAQALPGALALLGGPDALSGFLHYLTSPSENTLGQLGFAALLVGTVMLASNLKQHEQIRRDRAAIPLVIGGWGTRGKSGTERLKAAMLHALDVDVLVKTTGCEAMFIHGVPGRRPTEIFIHRSYDKATIWEQRQLLSLASRLSVSVFLWECMALSIPLVQVLSEEWMRDDLQTLTNAYPDHEDIQGPAGHDVARSIAAFIRSGGTTITTEEQMLPILQDEAQKKGARLIPVAPREHLLLADDLLARFPYREHPRNISLVRRLAVELGLDPDLATADMADHVVPDLGVLKAYPTMQHRGRLITFVNGMSANERTGFLSNWQRTGCERPLDQTLPPGQRGRWVVTVVNNRFDRVARSKVFADIVVRDAAAERHVLIGTNLSGLRVYIGEALTPFLQELRLFRPDDAPDQVGALVQARSERLRHRLRIFPAAATSVLAELAGWMPSGDTSALRPAVEEALSAAAGLADAHEPLASIIGKLRGLKLAHELSALWPEIGDELAAHACRSIARRALLASLLHDADRAVAQPELRAAVGTRQDQLYRELFLDQVVVVEDSGASGDQVIDFIARACPPGIDATVMGIQNIKGTGLDFVYRFIRYDEVNALCERLALAEAGEARGLVAALVSRSDFGMLDAALAARAVADAATRLQAERETAAYLTQSALQLNEIAQRARAALEAGQKQRRSPVVRFIEKTFDTADAVRRRWRSEDILDALVHREISHERAALEARRLVDREKKGWLR